MAGASLARWSSLTSKAEREGETLYAEAKGRTAADLDTLYGQLLRRMPIEQSNARFAVVVPTEARVAALRVPARVRELLRIDVYTVDAEGRVEGASEAEWIRPPADHGLETPCPSGSLADRLLSR
jgi:hypothetical protein